jgi:hypothetical protein
MARLDFNSEGVSDPTNFDVLPDGTEVLCVVSESEMVENKKGDGSFLLLTFDSIDAAHPGRKFWERLNIVTSRDDEKAKKMVTIAESQLAQLCRACGKVQVGDSEELHGIPVVLRLGIEPAKGDYPARQKIKAYKPADGSAPAKVDDAEKPAGKPARPAGQAPWAR